MIKLPLNFTPGTRNRMLFLSAALWLVVTSLVYGFTTTAFLNTTGDGLWSTAGNWSLGEVPGATSNAVVNQGMVVTLNNDAGFVERITAGNTPHPGTKIIISAALSTEALRIAWADGSFGEVEQLDGALIVSNELKIASTESGDGSGSYRLRGGSLDFSGVTMEVGTASSGVFTIHGLGVTSIQGTGLAVGPRGTLEFTLAPLGIRPVTVSNTFTIDPASKLIVDGSAYEGLDGFFPLVSAGSTSGSFDPANITLTGFGEREPAILTTDDGLWLRLTAPPPLSDRFFSMVPPSTISPSYSGTTFSATRSLDLSGSAWSTGLHEAEVMDTQMSQTDSVNSNRSWQLRIGRGGQIYSFHTPAMGELVPPQYHIPDTAPWVDEVWQGVAVDQTRNNPPDSKYFIHQAGVYLRDPAVNQPFYSPQVAARLDTGNRSFTTINWGQHAHVDIYADADPTNDWQSQLLYFTRYKDLGSGIIEVTLGFYNYGGDVLTFFNAPWGGVRRTSAEYAFLGQGDGTTWTGPLTDSFGGNATAFNDTGGWLGFSNSNTGANPTMGLVFGRDTVPLPAGQTGNSGVRWGYAGGAAFSSHETNWRNYFVTSNIRRFAMTRGKGFWSRYYFLLGDNVTDVSQRITARGINQVEELRAFDYRENSTPLIGYRFSGSGTGFQIEEVSSMADLYLYAYPVNGCIPIYEIIESDGARYLSWNPYATGTIKTYDGSIAGIRLLGFSAITADVSNSGLTHESLATVLNSHPQNYIAGGENLSVRVGALEDWLAQWSSQNPEINGSTLLTGDADNDGQSNLLEYILNSNPNHGSGIALQNLGEGITFTRNLNALETDLRVMVSNDLQTWNEAAFRSGIDAEWSAATGFTVSENETGVVKVLPDTSFNRRYYQLEASLR